MNSYYIFTVFLNKDDDDDDEHSRGGGGGVMFFFFLFCFKAKENPLGMS